MPDDGSLDEMVDGGGRFRPHWRRILDSIFGLGHAALAQRAGLLDRAFADEGFASLLPGARSVVWHCDPIPLPLSGAEFATLEAGLVQRARLLEAILADVYGPQHLLAEGVLPPALVYANPAFPPPLPRGRRGGTGRAAAAFLRRGSDPRTGRGLAGARGPDRPSDRSGLRAREPAHALAHGSRDLPLARDLADHAVFRDLAGRLAAAGRHRIGGRQQRRAADGGP